ncbi:hypothetical protein HKBW3S06_00594 [Candidatus Hakubella thermalkaliphila]|uniref:Glycosyl hydrolase family 13 catalytic domain-containing protein n=3 Tax=Candidatus Hakubella thermalkaliphila TaxID=2754717 RepID=A0A6V8NM51_9ACTN|nr:hypothetical protein HKBW3S06_00594 [Candidatus Hakubella thermalkaliphila]
MIAVALVMPGCAPQAEQPDLPVGQELPAPEQPQQILELRSPVIEQNNITFNYINDEIPADTRMFLRGNMPGVGWDVGLEMTRDAATGVWSITLDGLPPGGYEYKFYSEATGWIHDPLNPLPVVGVFGNSFFSIGELVEGIVVSVAGNFQSAYARSLGETAGDWTPGHPLTQLQETQPASGLFERTFLLPAGDWGYKITVVEIRDGVMSTRWVPEGLGNERKLILDEDKEVTFKFNYNAFIANPDSQPYIDSINYLPVKVEVFDGQGDSMGFMTDHDFDSAYSFKTGILEPGSHRFSISVDDGKHRRSIEVILEDAFDLELVYHASNMILTTNYAPSIDDKIIVEALYHNSHSTEYREPFGAVEQDTPVNIHLRTAAGDASRVDLVLGGKLVPMRRKAVSGHDIWSARVKIHEIGIYNYYFEIQDGIKTVYYVNEPGFGGRGLVVEGTPHPGAGYSLVVYKEGFKTSDWMKNSITYQIFPERFRDGDPGNNRAKTLGRGDIPLIFPEWDDFRGFENTRAQFVFPGLIRKVLVDGAFHSIDLNGWGLPEYQGDIHWHNNFYGGDLQGIIDSLDYLQSIGVRSLYLNPIFEATSTHKYDVSDKSNIDRMFGDNQLFKKLALEAKRRGMHIILDGVFNHVGDDSKYFDRYGKFPATIGAYEAWVYREMEKDNQVAIDWYNKWYKDKVEAGQMAWGPESPYDNWFEIRQDGTYPAWWGFDSLPEIGPGGHRETSVAAFMDYMVGDRNAIASRWIEYGSSGWRLDVSPQVEKDFWVEFRQRIMQAQHPNGPPIMIAENWGDATTDFLDGTFDSTMNYLFRSAVINFIADERLESKYRDDGLTPEEIWTPIDAKELDKRLMAIYERYPREAFYALMNLLGSHDIPRIMRVFGNIEADRLLYPGQRNRIAKGLGIEPAKMKNVFTIPDIWRQDLASRSQVMAFVNQQNELARRRVKAAFILQMGYPGSPTIYYGDELGMTGYHDPDNRRQMRWDKAHSGNEMLSAISRMAQIRAQHQVLKTGDLVTLMAEEGGSVYAFGRSIQGTRDALGNRHYTVNYYTGERLLIAQHNGRAIVAVNKARAANMVSIDVSDFAPEGTVFYDNLNDNREYVVENGKITLTVEGLYGAMLVDRPFVGK